jgi:hypothetical protein
MLKETEYKGKRIKSMHLHGALKMVGKRQRQKNHNKTKYDTHYKVTATFIHCNVPICAQGFEMLRYYSHLTAHKLHYIDRPKKKQRR